MRKVRLGDLGQIITGNTPSKNHLEFYESSDIPFIKPDDFESLNSISTSLNHKSYISEKARSKARIIPKQSVLVTCIGIIGKVMLTETEVSFNQQINAIIPNNLILAKYLAYQLIFNQNKLNFIANAPVVPIVNKTQFSDFEIQIHDDIKQQKVIVTILENIDSQIIKRRQQLTQFNNLVKSRFIEFFGHPETNEKGWKINTFADICTVRQGLQIPISKRLTEYEENCYKYITVQYLHGGKKQEYIKCPKSTVICNKEDILMTRTGNTGMVVTGVDGVFHNNFFLIDFDRNRYDKNFLVQYLNLDIIQTDIRRRAGTSTIPDLNHSEFYKIPVFEPPIELQIQFNNFIKQVDKSQLACQKSLDELETLKKSLMQAYFG